MIQSNILKQFIFVLEIDLILIKSNFVNLFYHNCRCFVCIVYKARIPLTLAIKTISSIACLFHSQYKNFPGKLQVYFQNLFFYSEYFRCNFLLFSLLSEWTMCVCDIFSLFYFCRVLTKSKLQMSFLLIHNAK